MRPRLLLPSLPPPSATFASLRRSRVGENLDAPNPATQSGARRTRGREGERGWRRYVRRRRGAPNTKAPVSQERRMENAGAAEGGRA